jgi:hypothetical protein
MFRVFIGVSFIFDMISPDWIHSLDHSISGITTSTIACDFWISPLTNQFLSKKDIVAIK